MFNDTPARKTDRLLGVRKRYLPRKSISLLVKSLNKSSQVNLFIFILLTIYYSFKYIVAFNDGKIYLSGCVPFT